jgi:putative hemolysin
VGEIHDEFDVIDAPQIVGIGAEAAMIFDGSTGLRDLESQHNIVLPEDPAYATLGGFVLAQLGFIPSGGESFEYAGYRFTVVQMDRRRVARVKLQRLGPVGSPPALAVEPNLAEADTTEPRTVPESTPSAASRKTKSE